MKAFKKEAVLGLVMTSMVGAAIIPSASHAIIGAVTHNIVLMALGGLGVAGAVAFKYPLEYLWLANGLFYGGIALLDGDEGRSVVFAPVSAEHAKKLGITSSEMIAYNSSLDELNAACASVVTELSKMNEPSVQEAAAMWGKYENSVDAEAMSAAKKVVAQLAK